MSSAAPIYEAQGARVTTSQVTAGGTVVPLAHVSTVRLERGTGMGWALLLFLASGPFMLGGASGWAGALIALAAAQAVRVALQWRVILTLTDGQSVTVTTFDRAHAARLLDAVSAALAGR